jgi:hypothetical protein
MGEAAQNPSLRTLSIELREWQERRRIPGTRIAATVRCSESTIARILGGTYLPNEDHLRLVINMLQIPAAERQRLWGLYHAAATARRERQGDQHLATEILAWAPVAVPVALRTELYARAVLRSMRVRQYPPSEIKQIIATGRDWQSRLTGIPVYDGDPPPDPLEIACILDEAVLHRRRGPTSAMAGQLDLLAELARLDAVTVQVLPLESDGPAVDTAYTVLGYGDGFDLADTVLVDGPAGTELVQDDKQTARYRYAFADLQGAAADPEQSAELIKRAADRWT